MRKVAIWGVGEHAQRNIIPAIMSSEKISLVGLWTRSSERGERVSERYGVTAFRSEKDLLSSTICDTVILCTPTGLHYQEGMKVLKSEKNLWCEKTLTTTPKVENLQNTAKESSLEIREMFMFLHHDQFRKLESIAKTGDLGRIISITARFGFPHLEPDNIRYDSSLGGGAMYDAGCYTVAAIHKLLGPKPSGITSRIVNSEKYHVDISGAALLAYPNDVYAVIEWGFGQFYRNEIEILASRGKLVAQRVFSKPETLSTVVTVSTPDGEEIKISEMNHFTKMFEEFADGNYNENWNLDQSILMKNILESHSD